MDASSLANVPEPWIVLRYHGNAEREVLAIWRDNSRLAGRRAWLVFARSARLWHGVNPFFQPFGLVEYARFFFI